MPFPIGAALGAGGALFGGLFGGSEEPSLSPQQAWAAKFLKRYAKRMMQEGNAPPLSLPQELMGLANVKGLAGEQMGGDYRSLLSALGARGSLGDSSADAIASLQQSQQGQLMNLDAQALFQSLLSRQGMKDRAASAAGQVAGITPQGGTQPGLDMGSLFQAIGRTWGYQQGRGSAGGSAFSPPSSSVSQSRPLTGGSQRPGSFMDDEDYFSGYGYGGF